MAMSVEELDAIFRDSFPMKGGCCSLEYVSVAATDELHSFRVTLRLVAWSELGGTIEDIKEQEVWCPTFGADRARIVTFFKAYDYVLGRVFAHSPKAELATLMPHELFDMRALRLARPEREDQFAKALAKKSRLGRFLPPTMRS